MEVEVRLFANLRSKLPAGSERGRCSLEVPDGCTLADLLACLGIPRPSAQMILINGEPHRDMQRPLRPGDVVSIFRLAREASIVLRCARERMLRHASLRESSDRFRKKREQTHRDLLAAACRVLAEKGYHRARVVDIAAAAGVSVGTFYLYYPTKEALLLEVAEEMIRALEAEVDAAIQSIRDPIERVRARNRTFFDFAQKHRELFRIVFGHGAEFHDVLRKVQDAFIADLAANFRDGIESGVLRPFDPHLLAHAFVGMAQQVLRWWIETDAMPAAEVGEAALDFALHGIERPLPPDSSSA